MTPSSDISRLIEIMAALRTPETGCPWDLEQDFASISPYTIEEAYEVADAIERKDWDDLCDELGDLLLQPVYHARMAEEAGLFDFSDVVKAITNKMIRRHPHVFGDEKARGSGMAKGTWEKIKAGENLAKAERKRAAGVTSNNTDGLLDDIPSTFPALETAAKIQKKAARVGFDWNDPGPILDKIREEVDEVTQAVEAGAKKDIEHEIGDLLFSVVNLARHMDIEPDKALRTSNYKFRQRFSYIERQLKNTGSSLESATPGQMDKLWNEAKLRE